MITMMELTTSPNIAPIAGFSDYYISSSGVVYSTKMKNPKILASGDNGKGYRIICLHIKGVKYMKYIHRLVAQAFIPNPNGFPEVNHKNEIKTDNRVGNLEWCTIRYNRLYGERNVKTASKNRNGKLSKRIIQKTRCGKVVKIWASLREAERNGYCSSRISECAKGTRLEYKLYIWEYA